LLLEFWQSDNAPANPETDLSSGYEGAEGDINNIHQFNQTG